MKHNTLPSPSSLTIMMTETQILLEFAILMDTCFWAWKVNFSVGANLGQLGSFAHPFRCFGKKYLMVFPWHLPFFSDTRQTFYRVIVFHAI